MMFKKWMGAAVLLGWCGGAAVAPAQYLPSPVGAARIPDPLPVGGHKEPPPKLVPGPISPQAAPPGPPPDLALPSEHTSAFQCEEFACHKHVFFHLGAQALQRNHLGHMINAYFDNGAQTSAGPLRLDTGIPGRPRDIVPIQDVDDIDPKFMWGPRATIGCYSDSGNCSYELTGFYLPEDSFSIQAADTGRINSFFFNFPLGFEGNNGIALQADFIRTTFETSLWSAELNARYYSKAVMGCEPILGIRYVDLYERFSVFLDDDGLAFRDPDTGATDPTRRATFSWRTYNRIVGPQFGLEHQWNPIKGVALGLSGKVTVGANFADVRATATRGDGFVGLSSSRDRINFAQVYEFGAMLDVYLLERMRVRAGYTTLFAVGVLEAVDQATFDLGPPGFREGNYGTVFYHGPSLELQFLF